jgi:uncharacterized ParB-like nuclease family protein
MFCIVRASWPGTLSALRRERPAPRGHLRELLAWNEREDERQRYSFDRCHRVETARELARRCFTTPRIHGAPKPARITWLRTGKTSSRPLFCVLIGS